MKKLLYISCNSKPEHLSVSRTVAREFIIQFLATHPDIVIKEIDLYNTNIPRLHYKYYKDRNSVVDGESYNNLTPHEKKDVDTIISLANEFKEADYYVISAPMWSLMFPAPLKEYLDCIIQNDITVKIDPNHTTGLLADKDRTMVYIQSSGGGIPWLLAKRIDHGGNYLRDIFKFMGIKDYYEILVDNTGFCEKAVHEAIENGKKEVKALATKLSN